MRFPTFFLSTACVVGMLGFSATARADYEERQIDHDRPSIGVILTEREGRVKVAHVIKDGPADEAGLERGDVIRSIDGERVRSPREVFRELREKDAGEEVEIEIRRDDDSETLTVEVKRLGDVMEVAREDDRLRRAAHFAALQTQIRQLQAQMQRLQRQIRELQDDQERVVRRPDERRLDRQRGMERDRDRFPRRADRDFDDRY